MMDDTEMAEQFQWFSSNLCASACGFWAGSFAGKNIRTLVRRREMAFFLIRRMEKRRLKIGESVWKCQREDWLRTDVFEHVSFHIAALDRGETAAFPSTPKRTLSWKKQQTQPLKLQIKF